ncbi:putative ureidoglycolate hydrolase [Aspergillus steynii IBT 23096]|uniref:Putative ureidoglycolate hydrolase n=1 Tax=Aspergillus steynii IBT 23096 TaxID=1392250 RepID=A0A2I2FW34_9EURO|nr:putative ureidoglycolate hydrolase [Aspergillus steynii IBT 23096]PLB44776.1 putative ureidoglycolate hydrolase [Aspergillus steynii IBT 23096]
MAPILSSPPPSLHLTPEPLTPDSFAPFGTAIVSPLPRHLSAPPTDLSSLPPHNPSPELANQSSALKYSPVSPLLDHYAGRCPSGRAASARMSMFCCFPRQLRTVQSKLSSTKTETPVFDVRILERHPFTTQTFIPIDLSSQTHAGTRGGGADDAQDEPFYLVVVAPTLKGESVTAQTESGPTTIQDTPDLKNLRAFVARGGQAVTYGAGTWHAPMAVVGKRRVDFVVAQFANGVGDEDCQEAAFGEGIVVELGESSTSSSSSRGGKVVAKL